MSNINEASIKEYFDELVEYHNNIFGVFSAATMKKVNYIGKSEKIFAFIDLLKKVDEEFDNSFLDLMIHDMVLFLKQQSLATHTTHKTVLSYLQFKQSKDITQDSQEQYQEFLQVIKKYKPLLENLLNTKFFYLDKYICHKVSESRKVQYFLGMKNITNLQSILQYVEKDYTSSYMKIDYGSFDSEESYEYDETQIEFIKSLAIKDPADLSNEGIEQLIKYKEHIHFFDGIEDEEIRYLITDVKFKQYKKDEPVIIERDTSLDIFFLVKGECRIMLKGEEIGRISPQSIFGEFAFITKEKRSATIKPTTPSVIISFNFDLYSFENNPCLFSRLYSNISNILVNKLTSSNN
jgi:hypothetical protein